MAEVQAAAVQIVEYKPPVHVPVSGPRGQTYQSMESFRVEKYNRILLLLGLFQHFWEQLERLRMVEEEYHHEKKLPTQAMCRARAQIGEEPHWIIVELRENDAHVPAMI